MHTSRATSFKTIGNMIFKVLWFPRHSEPVDRRKLIASYAKGGLNMVDIDSRCKAAVLCNLKEIYKAKDKTKLWIKYAYYSIGTILKNVNPNLYSNAEPHQHTVNNYWLKIKSMLKELNEASTCLDWGDAKVKKITLF